MSRWHAPKDTGDIIPPVLLRHTLLPVPAGFLAAYWRRPRPGRIARGILTGASVLFADFMLVFAHDAAAFSSGDSQGGGGILEIPAWLILPSVAGAVLGCLGALAGAASGGRLPTAERITAARLSRRILSVAASLALGAAVLTVFAVIPAVRADASPGATPERAVPAFEIMAVLNVYAAAAFLAGIPARAGRVRRPGALGVCAVFHRVKPRTSYA